MDETKAIAHRCCLALAFAPASAEIARTSFFVAVVVVSSPRMKIHETIEPTSHAMPEQCAWDWIGSELNRSEQYRFQLRGSIAWFDLV